MSKERFVTALTSMRPEEFTAFFELSVTGYAEDNVTAGRWPADGALERAKAEFHRLLPNGLATPSHFLYEIRQSEEGESIGFIWFAILTATDPSAGYLYNIRIKPQHRGKGHAKAALELLDGIARDMGLSSISLHTFSNNGGAQALYRSHGYWITGLNMRKTLNTNDA